MRGYVVPPDMYRLFFFYFYRKESLQLKIYFHTEKRYRCICVVFINYIN
ncbi:hypothetical protein CLOL250_01106 [Clostridium sp. L2-50]|nr:hypothetical protein CLOL250_01106 [Clostridium sp. L2-50]